MEHYIFAQVFSFRRVIFVVEILDVLFNIKFVLTIVLLEGLKIIT